ncbi:cytochrome B [Hahella sp. CCB-MM4]|uniref:cytochrome c oxidase subunit II n=1 Tax=Hahella sp. (strain CCB-MM4) TaxID=1926491 RepID=UPI000B9AC345|nr:cytochrome c oxidase subunit II [Hahella sp. CCB-MM4]OZG70729.1 cytochrome B [Hahella sp. CCB-MM4]
MLLAVILVVIVIASVLFHVFSPWHATEAASNWGSIDHALLITIVITGIFFVAVGIFVAVAIWRFHHKHGKRAAYEPENRKLEWWLIIITSIGIMGMLAPGLVVYNDFVHVPEDAAIVEVFGQQWQWSYRLPGEDGELGTSEIKWVSADNPLGVSPEDPKGQDDLIVVSNEIHLPLGQPVKVLLRSKDVLHNFYIPQIRSKMDMVPGLVSYFWFTPTKAGKYEILCAEFCGVGHYNMRGIMWVDEAEDYQQWLGNQTTFASSQSSKSMAASSNRQIQGRQLAENLGCTACHSLDGSNSLGPSWKDLYGKTETLTDGSTIVVDEDYIKESISQPKAKIVQGFPPVMVAYNLDDENLAALIALIKSLAQPSEESKDSGSQGATDQKGHGEKTDPGELVGHGEQAALGKRLVQNLGCTACHSTDGRQGVGPTWKNLFGKSETLADGSTVIADEQYLEDSILHPGAQVVKGFSPVMPTYSMNEEDLAAVLAYLESLSE